MDMSSEENIMCDDDVEGKLFIGGLSWQTTEATLRTYFEKFGELDQVSLMVDKRNGQPRGFAFVTMQNPAIADSIVNEEHNIDGRKVDVKKAVPREKAPVPRIESKKIFVGGLHGDVTDDMFREYFSRYGPVKDAVVMVDRTTNRSRGFGFVSFENEDSVDKCISGDNRILDKWVEVKRAEPKDLRYERFQPNDRTSPRSNNVNRMDNRAPRNNNNNGGGYRRNDFPGYMNGNYNRAYANFSPNYGPAPNFMATNMPYGAYPTSYPQFAPGSGFPTSPSNGGSNNGNMSGNANNGGSVGIGMGMDGSGFPSNDSYNRQFAYQYAPGYMMGSTSSTPMNISHISPMSDYGQNGSFPSVLYNQQQNSHGHGNSGSNIGNSGLGQSNSSLGSLNIRSDRFATTKTF